MPHSCIHSIWDWDLIDLFFLVRGNNNNGSLYQPSTMKGPLPFFGYLKNCSFFDGSLKPGRKVIIMIFFGWGDKSTNNKGHFTKVYSIKV